MKCIFCDHTAAAEMPSTRSIAFGDRPAPRGRVCLLCLEDVWFATVEHLTALDGWLDGDKFYVQTATDHALHPLAVARATEQKYVKVGHGQRLFVRVKTNGGAEFSGWLRQDGMRGRLRRRGLPAVVRAPYDGRVELRGCGAGAAHGLTTLWHGGDATVYGIGNLPDTWTDNERSELEIAVENWTRLHGWALRKWTPTLRIEIVGSTAAPLHDLMNDPTRRAATGGRYVLSLERDA